MRNLFLSALLVLFAVNVSAQDLSGNVGVDTRLVYRGVQLNNDASAYASGTLSNLFLDGLYVTGQVNTLTTTPASNMTARSDVGVGYHHDFDDSLSADVSFHRVFNPSVYAGAAYVNPVNNVYQNNYNEVRGRLSYKVLSDVTVYGEVGQLVSANFSNDTYFAGGVETTAFLPNLTVGGLVAGQHYENASSTEYNNSEVYARYVVWKGLSAEASYSFGGKSLGNVNLDNRGYVGVRYNF